MRLRSRVTATVTNNVRNCAHTHNGHRQTDSRLESHKSVVHVYRFVVSRVAGIHYRRVSACEDHVRERTTEYTEGINVPDNGEAARRLQCRNKSSNNLLGRVYPRTIVHAGENRLGPIDIVECGGWNRTAQHPAPCHRPTTARYPLSSHI